MDIEELKEFLKDNLEIVIDFNSPHSSDNCQSVGLKFMGDKECFTEETIYVPEGI
jgi:hypothetical protein